MVFLVPGLFVSCGLVGKLGIGLIQKSTCYSRMGRDSLSAVLSLPPYLLNRTLCVHKVGDLGTPTGYVRASGRFVLLWREFPLREGPTPPHDDLST